MKWSCLWLDVQVFVICIYELALYVYVCILDLAGTASGSWYASMSTLCYKTLKRHMLTLSIMLLYIVGASCSIMCSHAGMRAITGSICQTYPTPPVVTHDVTTAHGFFLLTGSICAGVPAFLANVPVLGSALRGVVIRSAQRMIQDIESILGRVNDTTDIHEVLRRAAKKGHAQEADKQAQAQRKEQQKQEAAEQKKSGRGGRFL